LQVTRRPRGGQETKKKMDKGTTLMGEKRGTDIGDKLGRPPLTCAPQGGEKTKLKSER